VNGDGYDDVIIGAHYNDDGGNNAGKAYVYLGTASGLSTTVSWTATGEAAGDYLGASVASAGDVDGDGYGDVIVGAHSNNDGGNDAGKVYVYLGSASSLSTTVSWTETGEVAIDYLGSSVASAGDVDDDGYGDIIVSAHGSNDAGKAYVYGGTGYCEHGGSEPATMAKTSITLDPTALQIPITPIPRVRQFTPNRSEKSGDTRHCSTATNEMCRPPQSPISPSSTRNLHTPRLQLL
jgi:hypothetical protein